MMPPYTTTVCYHEESIDVEEHLHYVNDGVMVGGVNVRVGRDHFHNGDSIVYYFNDDGHYVAWGYMMDTGIKLAHGGDHVDDCWPADGSLLSHNRRRVKALRFNHTTDWLEYEGSLPTFPDGVWLSSLLAGDNMDEFKTSW
jgi:hypothetical protein